MGLDYFRITQYEKSIECFEEALDIDQQSGGGWKWLRAYILPGQAYHKLGNHDREKEIYELGLRALPDHPNIIYQQAVCALSQGDTIEANEHLDKYRSVREGEGWEEYRILDEFGQIFRDAGHFDKAEQYKDAIRCYERAIELNNQYEDAWFNKGAALHMLGKDKKAIKALEQVLVLNPSNASAHEAIAICQGK